MSESNLSSSEHLLKRLDADIRMVHTQLEFLKIAFKNLQGSWVAVNQAYKIFKIETEEEL
ncbi:MAG: hypothetical protein BGO67_10600 [Alphaproteobacteria bacterium 41-28]|nr:MAG: hypothetical protein BGO67_10600 [Alphaproteobacteria bacterium 41-28]